MLIRDISLPPAIWNAPLINNIIILLNIYNIKYNINKDIICYILYFIMKCYTNENKLNWIVIVTTAPTASYIPKSIFFVNN